MAQLHLPSGGGGGRGCWSPGKRSLRPSAEKEREKRRDIPSLSVGRGHMSSGVTLLSPGSVDHRKAVPDKLLAETGPLTKQKLADHALEPPRLSLPA